MRSWRIAIPLRCLLALPVIAWLARRTVLAASTGSRAEAEPKRVLMLHSYGLRFKPWTDYAQIIRSEIVRAAQRPVDFNDHSLLNAEQSGEKSEGPFVEYLHALYAENPPDLIMAIGAPAANFVQRYRPRMFPATPMVFTAVERRRVNSRMLTQNDAVAAVAYDPPAIFDNILRVLPLTKAIAIVSGVTFVNEFDVSMFRRG